MSDNLNSSGALQIQTKSDFLNSLRGASNLEITNSGDIVMTNAVLPADVHLAYKRALMETAKKRLLTFDIMRSRGLVTNLDSLGIYEYRQTRVGELTGASWAMPLEDTTQRDILDFDEISVPIPIVRKDFVINERTSLAYARGNFGAYDTVHIRAATRVVSEAIESMIFNGIPTVQFGGTSPQGLLTYPRNMYNLASTGWLASDADIIGDVLNMVEMLRGDNYLGPYTLFVAENLNKQLLEDYSATKGDNTVRDRILAIPSVSEILISSSLPDGNVLMLEPDLNVFEIVMARDISFLSYNVGYPFNTHFTVLAAMAPFPKRDKLGQTGTVHGTP